MLLIATEISKLCLTVPPGGLAPIDAWLRTGTTLTNFDFIYAGPGFSRVGHYRVFSMTLGAAMACGMYIIVFLGHWVIRTPDVDMEHLVLGRHIGVDNQRIGSDNGLSPIRHQAII